MFVCFVGTASLLNAKLPVKKKKKKKKKKGGGLFFRTSRLPGNVFSMNV